MKNSHEQTETEVYLKVAGLGTVAGLRAMSAPALFALSAARKEKTTDNKSFFASGTFSLILGLLAVGEFVGDKLPNTPNRTEAAGLGARIISGAVVGGLFASAHKKSALTGSIIGGTVAIAAAYAGQNIRHSIAEQTGIASPLIGAVEDAIAIGIGAAVLKEAK